MVGRSERAGQGGVRPRLLGQVLLQAALMFASGFTFIFVFWLMPGRAGALLSKALEAAGGSAGARARAGTAGSLWLGQILLLLAAMSVASSVVPHWAAEPSAALATALVVLLPAALAAACAPFALAPFALLDGAGSVGTAIGRSFELSARRGALVSARDAAAIGAGVAGLLLLAGSGPAWSSGFLLLRAVVVVVTLACAAFLLACVYVAATKRSVSQVGPLLAPRLRTIIALMVPSLVALGAALVTAMLTPTGMRVTDDEARPPGEQEIGRTVSFDAIEVAGPHGLRVRRGDGGVWIETADGGGAGYVDSDEYLPVARELSVARSSHRGREAYVARLGERWMVYFDERGVRLDDEVADRLAARFGVTSWGALLLALLLAAAWGLRLVRALAEARVLDAVAATASSPAPDGALGRVAGRIRLGVGSSLTVRGTVARVEGDARVVSRDGDVVFAMPQEVRLFAPHDGHGPIDGDEVEVVGRLGKLTPGGVREGALAWPAGARLLIGPRAEAAHRLLSHATRGGALVTAGIALLLVFVALSIVTAL